MNLLAPGIDYVEIFFKSDFSDIDIAIATIEEYLFKAGIYDFARYKFVSRELMINAVEHGNQKERVKTVSCRIKINELTQKIAITVRDEGSGFDYSKANFSNLERIDNPRSRGLSIVKNLSAEIQFNKQGNEITAIMDYEKEIDLTTTREGDEVVILPNENLTAKNQHKLIAKFKDMLDPAVTTYTINLKKVTDIDSMALSAIIGFGKSVKSQGNGSRVRVVGATPDITLLFSMIRLGDLIEFDAPKRMR